MSELYEIVTGPPDPFLGQMGDYARTEKGVRGLFVKPIQLSPGKKAYLRHEVEEWLNRQTD